MATRAVIYHDEPGAMQALAAWRSGASIAEIASKYPAVHIRPPKQQPIATSGKPWQPAVGKMGKRG